MSNARTNTDYPIVNFTGNCGEAPGPQPNVATSASGMAPFQSASINGGPPSNCVVGNNGATVFNITLTKTTGIYTYQVSVDGQGPKGAGTGYFHLAFTDQSGDTYYLKLHSSTREQHTVDYNSKQPNIVKIWWCDVDFTVPSSNTEKPDFKVTSPAK
jgi:hypothetical protein